MLAAGRMSAEELRASISLSSISGPRMLGMFVILPVFAIYAEKLPRGDDLTLVGIAIGAYGLTQAILQIPFGFGSDRYGCKPVIYAGLVIFALGSFIAAAAANIYLLILGCVLQGASAISAAVMAMAMDLTREEHRTKAMAMIGSTRGTAFALHAVLMALFIAVPFSLRESGMALDNHWQVYLPGMVGSFALMLPGILRADQPVQLRRNLLVSVAALLATQELMPLLPGNS